MQFQCQRSGKCCSHPNIVITITHKDIWQLVNHFDDYDSVLSVIKFVKVPEHTASPDLELPLSNETFNDSLVLKPIMTTEGSGIFILRKQLDRPNQCVFYDPSSHSCTMYASRPLACQNFPFGISTFENRPIVTWVKDAGNFCPGIGKGKVWSDKTLQKIGKNTFETLERYSAIVKEINYEAELGKPLTPENAVFVLYSAANTDNVREIPAI